METVRPHPADEPEGPAPSARVLVVDAPGPARDRVRALAAEADGVELVEADDARAAAGHLAGGAFHLCLAAARAGGLEVARAVRLTRRPTRVAVAAGPDVDEVAAAVRAGADDLLPDPPPDDRVRRLLADAARDATPGPGRYYGVVSRNPRMHAVFELVRDVGPTTSTVLIIGETGTGKEELARAVHAASAGRPGPFVAVNCAAVPENLLESELFGHERGSFTGADRQRIGKFELAQGGTLFLDEVGDIPPLMQVKLLRVLQDRRFERVGGSDPIQADVRVVAATNRPLRRMLRKGTFREDLYYRLNVVRIDLPPLRDRADDIPALVEHFCRKYARPGVPPKRPTPAALDRLARYLWPGNIRELENAVERACVVHPGEQIEPAHLPPELHRRAGPVALPIELGRPLRELLREVTARIERRYIVKALRKTGGHVGRAAKLCGYCRRSLTAKIGEYRIDRLAYTGKG